MVSPSERHSGSASIRRGTPIATLQPKLAERLKAESSGVPSSDTVSSKPSDFAIRAG